MRSGRPSERTSYESHRRDERDRDDEDAGPHIGRGPRSHDEKPESDSRNRNHERKPDRGRDHDPRDVFTRDLNLPREREREIVRDRDREYTLRGSESRTLATVGAFRVVSSRDLRDRHDRSPDPRSGDLRHLREQGLVETIRVPGSHDYAVSLTKAGRSLLESHGDRDREGSQTFHAGVKRESNRDRVNDRMFSSEESSRARTRTPSNDATTSTLLRRGAAPPLPGF